MKSTSLLPREQYAEAQKGYGRGPSLLELKSSGQVLCYFGANHSRDPADHQYPILREFWKRFLEQTQGHDRIVLIEGGLRKVAENEDQAILRNAEGGLITLLAEKAEVTIACPDLSPAELAERLPQLNPDLVLLYWFLGWLNNYQKYAEPKPDFEKSVEGWCEFQRSKPILGEKEITLPRLRALYKQVLYRDLDETADPNDLVNPNKNETPINKVARAYSDLRDLNIASEIERYWQTGKSIFVVFGQGHLIIEEPALRQLVEG